MITNAFKVTVAGEAVHKIAAKIHGKVVSFKSYINWGACGQKNTDLLLAEEFAVVS